MRGLAVPFMRFYFRLRVEGAEHIPKSGPAIVAPNHKSFWDTFFVAAATGRHVHFMGKVELFDGPFGGAFVRLGAFPVRRGLSDADALETARILLRQGHLLALLPEGTRVRDADLLGTPRRGAARLALEMAPTHPAPLIPAAITGTQGLFLGPVPKPKRVQVAFGEPIAVAALEATPETAGRLIEEQVWPEVTASYTRLRDRPGLVVAGLAAVGLAGLVAGRRRRRKRS